MNTLFACLLKILIFITGMCTASFMQCHAFRFTYGISHKGKSRCDSCKHELNAADLIPVLSYALLKGRCRYCGDKISFAYPLIELTGGMICLLIYLKEGLTSVFFFDTVLFFILLCISLTDIHDYLVPAHLVVAGIIDSFILYHIKEMSVRTIIHRFSCSILICLILDICALLMKKMLGKEALGGGDVLVFFILGNCFPLDECLMGMVLSCILGIFHASFSKNKDKEIPFVPFINVAFFIIFILS